AMQQRHAEYFLALAERAEPELRGSDQATWLERLDTEHDNLRAALLTFEKLGDWVSALRMSGALGWFWFRRGYLSEGRERLLDALTGGVTGGETTVDSKQARAKALFA